MPENPEKQAKIAALLTGEPVLARLATTNPKTLQPHVTPVWFLWDGASLWISAFISTRKAKDVARNHKIAVLIEPKTPAGLDAVLMEGACEFLEPPDERIPAMSLKIYERYVGADKISDKERSWTTDPENRLIKLTPSRLYSW
jgi:nitroimidazol reductase NimA-like FMN-containing flavoprotein (pyridoxamine 5'-phosphate oxidase superfamily)